MSIDHRPSDPAQRALDKATWLRTRKHVDPEVAETIDVMAETIIRMDAHARSIEGRHDRAINRVESKLGQLERRLKDAGIAPTKERTYA